MPLAPDTSWAIRTAIRRGTPSRPSVCTTFEVVSVTRTEPSTASPRLPAKFRTVWVTPVTAP